jgi:hypothetical protein
VRVHTSVQRWVSVVPTFRGFVLLHHRFRGDVQLDASADGAVDTSTSNMDADLGMDTLFYSVPLLRPLETHLDTPVGRLSYVFFSLFLPLSLSLFSLFLYRLFLASYLSVSPTTYYTSPHLRIRTRPKLSCGTRPKEACTC